MRPCQKEHYLRKLDSYQEKINQSLITIEEQKKRIECFQGLINQLKSVLLVVSEKTGDVEDEP